MGDNRLKPRPRRQLRQATLVLGICLVLYCLLFLSSTSGEFADQSWVSSQTKPSSRHPPPELLSNLSLGEDECNAAFPGLTKEIDDTVAEGPFKVKQTGGGGPVQGRIKDGQITIIHAQRKIDLSTEMVNSRTAALHQLHRAILTSPAPLPDTIFTLNFQDQPFGTAWTYSRAVDPAFRSKDANTRSFLMPHFSFWAWNLPFIGSVSRAARAITSLEREYSGPGGWQRKIGKAVWRGTAWFNSVHSPRMRQKLLNTARGKPWADVETLEWTNTISGRNASNALPIEGFCRYKYVVHTEGITYSGRFQFLQMCASVVLTPPIQWAQHTTHLVRPLFSSSLDLGPETAEVDEGNRARGNGKPGADEKRNGSRGTAKAARGGAKSAAASGTAGASGSDSSRERARHKWVPAERIRKAWPVQYDPDQANIVFVAPDWSDLEPTVAWLEAHPKVAEGIARRQRDLFAGGGYFSPAAETCYWRALVRGWAKVAQTEGEGWEGKEGVAFEAFSLHNGE